MMKLLYDFNVLGKIHGKSRPRFSSKSRTAYTPKATVYYENYIREMFLLKYEAEQVKDNLHIEIIANMYIPKNTSKKKKEEMINGLIRPSKKPDIDNVAKSVLDALNGVAYMDDKQVVSLDIKKTYSEIEGLNIKIFKI